jgi:hypothetical protein
VEKIMVVWIQSGQRVVGKEVLSLPVQEGATEGGEVCIKAAVVDTAKLAGCVAEEGVAC